MDLKGLNVDTPLEEYEVRNRIVHVKRDDLMGDGINLPSWGKCAAIYELVKQYVDVNRPLTHLSVDGSWSGWVLAAVCENLGMEFYLSYPDSKKINKDYIGMLQDKYPSMRLNPIRPNMMQIMYNSLRGQAKINGWQMLPYAFNHDFYKSYMSDRIQKFNHFDNLVVSSGSGVTLSGLVMGYYKEELTEFFPNITKKVWTTCVSSVNSIHKMLKANGIPYPINIRKSEFDFNDRMDTIGNAPFPCNQFWDIKQWHWLEHNIDELEGSILFWNIGGIYKW